MIKVELTFRAEDKKTNINYVRLSKDGKYYEILCDFTLKFILNNMFNKTLNILEDSELFKQYLETECKIDNN